MKYQVVVSLAKCQRKKKKKKKTDKKIKLKMSSAAVVIGTLSVLQIIHNPFTCSVHHTSSPRQVLILKVQGGILVDNILIFCYYLSEKIRVGI